MKDLNLLNAFEALWRDRSVTAAAERLGLTQAAVSGSLRRLRGEFEDKLFTQVGRKMEPTPLAVDVAPQLLDALALVRKAQSERVRFTPATAKRMFTVRTRDIGEVTVVPRLQATLAQLAPGIQLRSVFLPIPETMSGLANGQIDFAMGFLPILETGIHKRLLAMQHYVCVMRAGHPLAKNKLTLDRFVDSDHLLVEYSGSGHLQLERALIEAGAGTRIRVRLPQYLSAPHSILNSDMMWSVPAALAESLAQYYPLVIKPHPLQLPEIEVCVYWHDRYHRDPANKWLRDLVAQQFATS